MLAIAFPSIDPVLFTVGPLTVRWYALAYVFSFILGFQYCMQLARRAKVKVTAEDYDAFMMWGIVGTILGGRIGYVLFYNFGSYLQNPLEAFAIWHGGMSFHGGAIGVILAAYFFARKIKVPFLSFTDILVCAVPIGLFFGRLANFVNGELFGRLTDVEWGMVFPKGGPLPRHPSQLYEAFFEGLVLFVVLALMVRRPWVRDREGFLSGAFLALYGIFRFGVEYLREPDEQLVGFLSGFATMGQVLCVPMLLLGSYLMVRSLKVKNV